MRKDKAIAWAKTRCKNAPQQALACWLGITAQAVSKWPDIIPLKQALRLVALSGGKLALRAKDYA